MCDPIKFVREDVGDDVLFCCGDCGTYCGRDEDYARYHCGGKPCSRCGKPSDKHRVMCEKCVIAERNAKSKAVRDKAEVVSALDHNGPVYWVENEEFYDDIDYAFDAMRDENNAMSQEWRDSQTLYACKVFHLTLDAAQIIESALECQDHHYDSYDAVPYKGWKRLNDFIAKWNAEYGSRVSTWEPNYKKRIVIPLEWWS